MSSKKCRGRHFWQVVFTAKGLMISTCTTCGKTKNGGKVPQFGF